MKNVFFAMAVVSSMFIVQGCGRYYRIDDPTTSKTYYTKKIKEERGGAIEFTDAATGTKVTLQNSEILEVNHKTFDAGVHGGN